MKNVLKKNVNNKNLKSSLKPDGLNFKRNSQDHIKMKMKIDLGSKFFQRTSKELKNSIPNLKIYISKLSTNSPI